MKTIKNKFFFIIICLFGVLESFSAPSPPMPTGKKLPPPPPGLPIDEDLYLVLVLGLIYGIYFIYNYQIKQKTPI